MMTSNKKLLKYGEGGLIMSSKELTFDFDNIKPKPTFNRIYIYGGALSGKTTLVGKLLKKTIFVSTDGNAKRQGYQAINFNPNYKTKAGAEQERPELTAHNELIRIFKILKKNEAKFDGIAFDLIEGIDNELQVQIDNAETMNKDDRANKWGPIKSFYMNLYSLINRLFPDKVVFFLSRETTWEDEKTKKQMREPALRKSPRNSIDGNINTMLYIDKNHIVEFDGDYGFDSDRAAPSSKVEAGVYNNLKALMEEQGTI